MTPEYMEKEKLMAKIEAVLFARGEAAEIAALSRIAGAKIEEIEDALALLSEEMKKDSRGLTLIRAGQKAQIATKPEFAALVEEMIKEELSGDLGPASVEALAIIAYLGPISRAEIEYYRGVNSSFTLRSLLMRGLIERASSLEKHGRYHYQVSVDFLKHLGISKIDELPEHGKLKDELEKIKSAPSLSQ